MDYGQTGTNQSNLSPDLLFEQGLTAGVGTAPEEANPDYANSLSSWDQDENLQIQDRNHQSLGNIATAAATAPQDLFASNTPGAASQVENTPLPTPEVSSIEANTPEINIPGPNIPEINTAGANIAEDIIHKATAREAITPEANPTSPSERTPRPTDDIQISVVTPEPDAPEIPQSALADITAGHSQNYKNGQLTPEGASHIEAEVNVVTDPNDVVGIREAWMQAAKGGNQ